MPDQEGEGANGYSWCRGRGHTYPPIIPNINKKEKDYCKKGFSSLCISDKILV